MHNDEGYGTREHYNRVWSIVKSQALKTKGGDFLKPSRWWSMEMKGYHFSNRGEWVTLFMLLIYIGWERGWWKRFEETPLFNFHVGQYQAEPREAEEPDALEEAAAEESEPEEDLREVLGDGDAAPGAVARGKARKEVQARRGHALHTMHFAAQVIARPLSRRLFHASCEICQPLRSMFDEELQLLATVRGRRNLHVDLAQNTFLETERAVVQHFGSRDFAAKTGFIASDVVYSPPSHPSPLELSFQPDLAMTGGVYHIRGNSFFGMFPAPDEFA